MAPIRKHGLYQLAAIAWGVAVFGVVILVISGNARPFLAPDSLPIDGPFQMVGVAVVLVVAGALAIDRLEKREWTAAGEQAGLSPSGGGLRGKPDLVGTVDGREVRARTVKRETGGDGESGSSKTTFTVVETDLAEPTDRGLSLSPDGGADVGPESIPADLSGQLTVVDGVAALAESEALAREAVTPRVRNGLADLESDATVNAGPAADIFLDAIRKGAGGMAGSMVGLMEDTITERMPGGPEAVGTERKGVILDGDALAARAEAVVAVADGFEAALEATAAS